MSLSKILIDNLNEKTFELNDMLLNDALCWDSLLINKKLPIIHRVSLSLSEDRTLFLQKVFPTNNQDALMHSHSWPFALRILDGGYEMGMGYSSDRDIVPEVSFIIEVKPGNTYSFVDSNMWHYTKSYNNQPSYSVLIVGNRKRERKALNNDKLSVEQILNLKKEFLLLCKTIK